METTDRHLRLLTETIAAVNSTLDLEEVLHLVANEVAAALDADACFVYLYDEAVGELVLRATHGTPLDEMTRRPRLRPGEGITGTAAAERRPVAIAANADLDPRWKEFSNLPESEFESILAVPILDTGFVVARRLKYRQPITAPDKAHLHHRFVNIGFSQRRAVVYIWFWVGTLAAAALGTRFIPFREGGHWHTGPTIAAAALGLLAVGASIYMVYLLEIVKLANPRVRRRRREAEERQRRSA